MRTYDDYVAECNQHGIPPWSESEWNYHNEYEKYQQDPGLMPKSYSYEQFVDAHQRFCSYFNRYGSD